MQSIVSTLQTEEAQLRRFKLLKMRSIKQIGLQKSPLKPTSSNTEFERCKEGWSFDFTNYLFQKYKNMKPHVFTMIFRMQDDTVKATSFITFFGKYAFYPDLLFNKEKPCVKHFSNRNDSFNYILLSLLEDDMTYDSVYEYIPKNRSFALNFLVNTIVNSGKRNNYIPKEVLFD
jgi:hypothetical protein